MKLGQTSFFNFGSQILASVLGFVATVLITQLLGSEVFGVYALIIAVVIWLKTVAIMGIRSAVMKRLSEEGESGPYVVAGAAMLVAVLAVLSLLLVVFAGRLNAYIGQPITLSVIALTWASAFLALVTGILQGQHLVHLASVLIPLNTGLRSVVQIGSVLLGLGLSGILFGYGVGAVLAALLGVVLFVSVDVERPERCHFQELLIYARFSWLGRLSGRTFRSMDTIILGVFVSTGLIGIYEVAWNLASMLAVFATAIGQTLFPEISKISSTEDMSEVRQLLKQGLTYSGLFLVPGLIGSAAIGDLVLRIYGLEFSRGHLVLVLLVLARLLYSYADQLLTVLNGIDRPDLAFRINGVFITANFGLNWLLVWQYGWLGAAVATVVSATVALGFAYRYTDEVIGGARVPLGEVARQLVAAGLMGMTVFLLRIPLPETLAVGIGLVAVGSVAYFVVLLGISIRFRTTVRNNLPENYSF